MATTLPTLGFDGHNDTSAANGFAQNAAIKLETPVEGGKPVYILMAQDHFLLTPSCDFLFSQQDADKHQQLLGALGDEVYLGQLNEKNVFARSIKTPDIETLSASLIDLKLIPIRTLMADDLLPATSYGMVAQARSLLSWHEMHPFCARCGEKSVLAANGRRRDCPSCEAQHFPRVDPVVIMLAIHEGKCLMGRHHRLERVFTTLAGFVEPGETLEDAVRRELHEEAGVVASEVRYACSQPWPFTSSLMLGAYAKVENPQITIQQEELVEASWFTKSDVKALMDNTLEMNDAFIIPPHFTIARRLIEGFLNQQA